jgi:hypothetical protein
MTMLKRMFYGLTATDDVSHKRPKSKVTREELVSLFPELSA